MRVRPVALLPLLAAAAVVSAAAQESRKPFVLFASYPLVGHTTPLVFTAAELARRGVAGRVVVANVGFQGGPHPELLRMFNEPSGEAYGTGVEFVQVGHTNRTAKGIVDTSPFLDNSDVRCPPLFRPLPARV